MKVVWKEFILLQHVLPLLSVRLCMLLRMINLHGVNIFFIILMWITVWKSIMIYLIY